MKKKLLLIALCLLCCACTTKDKKEQFKKEYEKYNGEYIELNLDNTKIIKYSTQEEVNNIINNKTGVIYIGTPKDNLSRKAIEILLQTAENTGLDKIYYLKSLDGIENIEEINNKNIPLVLFVLEGKLVSYHQGTIDDKIELTEDETIELYNIYSEGAHKVLQDACDEEC